MTDAGSGDPLTAFDYIGCRLLDMLAGAVLCGALLSADAGDTLPTFVFLVLAGVALTAREVIAREVRK